VTGKIRIRLSRSAIGEKPGTRQALRGLGLRRIGYCVVRPDDAAIRGMVRKVVHLVDVETVSDEGGGPKGTRG
jgi:large subunit ribosomal protein L30